jgi:hypothetical protein
MEISEKCEFDDLKRGVAGRWAQTLVAFLVF